MIVRRSRRRAAFIALLATLMLGAAIGPGPTAAHAPGIDRFLYALGQVESGGNYTARNPTSGAYGKYQIMPFNWGPWAKKYIGSANAPQSPRNQEIVARGKVHDLYHWLKQWRRVAYWWLTGSTKTSGWSTYATRYVAKVMRIYRAEAAPAAAKATRFSENSARITYKGRWRAAEHAGYRGDGVRYAKGRGATASFAFDGTRVAWYGPKGPTRGKARVYLDGRYIKTVDLRASTFRARSLIFSKQWSNDRPHVLTIKVLGTSGRPAVAIDEFLVWD